MSNADVLGAINDFQEKKGNSLLGGNAVIGALKQMNEKIFAVNN